MENLSSWRWSVGYSFWWSCSYQTTGGRLYLGNKNIASQVVNLGNLSNSTFTSSKWSIENYVYHSSQGVGKNLRIKECSLAPRATIKLCLSLETRRILHSYVCTKKSQKLARAQYLHQDGVSFSIQPENAKFVVPHVMRFLSGKSSSIFIGRAQTRWYGCSNKWFFDFFKVNRKQVGWIWPGRKRYNDRRNPSSHKRRISEFSSGIDKLAKTLNSKEFHWLFNTWDH